MILKIDTGDVAVNCGAVNPNVYVVVEYGTVYRSLLGRLR